MGWIKVSNKTLIPLQNEAPQPTPTPFLTTQYFRIIPLRSVLCTLLLKTWIFYKNLGEVELHTKKGEISIISTC